MGDKYISMKCSGCGANLNVASDREVFFCEFCGQKHFLRYENHCKYTYRKVDDARIREADVKESIRLEELKLERLRFEKEMQQKRISMWMKFIPLAALVGLMILLSLLMIVVEDEIKALAVFSKLVDVLLNVDRGYLTNRHRSALEAFQSLYRGQETVIRGLLDAVCLASLHRRI